MTDVIIVVEEPTPGIVITTTEQVPNISIPSNRGVVIFTPSVMEQQKYDIYTP